jgi:WD40 repeat protein
MQIQKLQKESIFWWGDMAFSPDGKLLVAKGNHADLVLWDIESEQSIGEPLAGQIFVFSPDGNTLAASNADQIILWDINPQSWIERTCQRAGRNFTRLEWAKYFPNEEYRATCPQWSLESELVKTP